MTLDDNSEETIKSTRRASLAACLLFKDQAVTISKVGMVVSVQCDNGDDANKIFEWLVSLSDRDP